MARAEPAAERGGSELPGMLPGETEPQGAADANTVSRPIMAKVRSRFVRPREQNLPASSGLRIKVRGDRTVKPYNI